MCSTTKDTGQHGDVELDENEVILSCYQRLLRALALLSTVDIRRHTILYFHLLGRTVGFLCIRSDTVCSISVHIHDDAIHDQIRKPTDVDDSSRSFIFTRNLIGC